MDKNCRSWNGQVERQLVQIHVSEQWNGQPWKSISYWLKLFDLSETVTFLVPFKNPDVSIFSTWTRSRHRRNGDQKIPCVQNQHEIEMLWIEAPKQKTWTAGTLCIAMRRWVPEAVAKPSFWRRIHHISSWRMEYDVWAMHFDEPWD